MNYELWIITFMICQDEFVSRMLILCPVQGDAGLSDYRGNLAKIVKHYFVGISDGAQISMGIRTLGPDPRPEIIFQTCQIGHMAHPRRSSTGSSWGWEVWKMSWLGPGGAWERDICAYIYIHTYYNMYIYKGGYNDDLLENDGTWWYSQQSCGYKRR